MTVFLVLPAIIAVAGGFGGLASYLLLPASNEDSKSADNSVSAMRFVVAGAITAFVVPLFLSLAQSSLVSKVISGWDDVKAFPDVLVLVGFCVVAGFGSKKFMDSVGAKLWQMQQDVRRVEKKAEVAIEAAELNEEKVDHVAEVGIDRPSVDLPVAAVPESPSPRSSEVVARLSNEERAVVRAMSMLSKRTQTGIARDSGVPRSRVGEIIQRLQDLGIAMFTTAASTGSLRVALTSFGIEVRNALSSDERR